MAWLRDVHIARETMLVSLARSIGLGIHPVSTLHDVSAAAAQPGVAGLVMGDAALDTKRIERGVGLLGQAVDGLPT